MGQQEQAFDVADEAAAALEHPTARVPRRRAREQDDSRTRKGEGEAVRQSKKPMTPIRAIRLKLGKSQRGFWPIFGVTQTAGCRYESEDRPIPLPVLMLVLGHAEGKISRELLSDLKALVKKQSIENEDGEAE